MHSSKYKDLGSRILKKHFISAPNRSSNESSEPADNGSASSNIEMKSRQEENIKLFEMIFVQDFLLHQ